MDILQILVNGLVLGALYACIAVGFSLVWGVLNIINMLHGSFIILGGYLTFFAWFYLGLNPILALPVVALVLYALGYVLQYIFINKVVTSPVLTTLTLTFGLDMILYNLMTVYFTATPRRVTMDMGSADILGVIMPMDRVMGMALAFLLTGLLYVVMRASTIGRAIVAVRMDRQAAALMGIRV
ncbi:MAG: branched-chain amino acid ABC transporter permease, partial [Alphaproteobacteria bacterium]|nr:branched-chain amino acid ABC transporter permease [Alphaproteobacteria bacterium]